MEDPMSSPDSVLSEIRVLCAQNGAPPNKKHVKKHYPELLRHALYYFPSWEHAVTKATE